MSLNLGTSASSSTTNSSLRAGGGTNFTYAGAVANAGISLPVPLFRNEKVLTEGGRWSAELALRNAELGLEAARRNVIANTLTYFYNALNAQEQTKIAEESQREAEELLRITQEKLKLGKIAEIDAMESQVSADSARIAISRQQSAAATALDELKNFLGIPLDEELRVEQPVVENETLENLHETTLYERALAQRTDVKQDEIGIKMLELGVRQTEAQARPGVALSGGYSRSGQGVTISDSYNNLINPSWNIGLGTSLSLSPKADRASIDQARSSLRLARLNQSLHKDEIRLEIRRLLRETQNAAANAALLAETVKRAEENLRIRQVQFEHGLCRPIDVMQTERQLEETRMNYSFAAIDYRLAKARLDLAVGETPYHGSD
jgi:outer membrane protein TolC